MLLYSLRKMGISRNRARVGIYSAILCLERENSPPEFFNTVKVDNFFNVIHPALRLGGQGC